METQALPVVKMQYWKMTVVGFVVFLGLMLTVLYVWGKHIYESDLKNAGISLYSATNL
jgi:hypothetical protein